MHGPSRRDFLKTAGATLAAGAFSLSSASATKTTLPAGEPPGTWEFGLASYSFRAFSLEQVLDMTRRLGLHRITLKDMHLPLTYGAAEIGRVLEKLQTAGVTLMSCGVVYMKSEEDVRRAFAFAARAGLKMLVGVPDRSLLDTVEQAVKATGIALAIHNHGPGDEQYPGPESAYRLLDHRDERLGLCIDVGHTQRLGLDPAAEVERFFDRLLDIHIKDVNAATAEGTTVEAGRGVIDLPGLLRVLNRLGYRRTCHLEFEKDEKDPLPGVAESLGYLRGVQATLSKQ